MIELVAQEGLALDVASGGELAAARAAGFPPAATSSFTATTRPPPRSSSRSTTASATWSSTRSPRSPRSTRPPAGAASCSRCWCASRRACGRPRTRPCRPASPTRKFGFGLTDGQADEALERCLAAGAPRAGRRARPHRLADLRPVVVPPRGRDPHGRARASGAPPWPSTAACSTWAAASASATPARDQPSSIAEFADGRDRRVAGEAARHGMTAAHHPGRARALDRRQGGGHRSTASARSRRSPGVRTYVAVDGGMSDNIRPMLYGSRYEAMIGNRADVPASFEATVVGKHCESGDVLVRDVHDRAARARRRAGHARHRRLRLRHGQQLQRPAAAGGGHGGRRPARA